MNLSIVIPTYNEEKNVALLHDEISKALQGMAVSYSVVFVDDGSSDGTFKSLKEIRGRDNRVRVVKFKKNFGQSAAMAAGFEHAKGDIVVTMDADMQNDPADIPLLLAELDKGYDVVCGWRKKRKDSIPKKLFSLFANALRRKLTGATIHDSGCSLRAYRKECLKSLELYGEMHRYIPAMLSWKGYKIGEVRTNHRPRAHGKTKYGYQRLIKGFLDLILILFWQKYSMRPIHLLGGSGILLAIIGFLLGVYLVVERLAFGVALGDRPLFMLAILMIIVGIQFLVFGVLADIMVRIYYGQGSRRHYTVEEVLE
ncbi:MAG: glycosyltransferase family 2 protein [Dehalococcoidia bacterium]|jgi:glycosyltransferase involved in cell wall biosynthesis